MHQPSAPRRFTVTALFTSLQVEASFLREDWPAHVTLAGNFVTQAPTSELVLAIGRAEVLAEPCVIHFGDTAQFGPNRDMPVRLVLPGRVSTLHQKLADELEQLAGFLADEPDFWRGGYRPHLTLRSAASTEFGKAKEVAQIAVAQLSGERASIVATFDLPTHDSA